jgi:hypothetical protein
MRTISAKGTSNAERTLKWSLCPRIRRLHKKSARESGFQGEGIWDWNVHAFTLLEYHAIISAPNNAARSTGESEQCEYSLSSGVLAR